MSKIANFKKRQLKTASQLPKSTTVTEMPSIKPNVALTLLAKLLQVEESDAIATAEKYIDRNINFFADLADGEDQTVTATVEVNEKGNIEKITDVKTFDRANEVVSELNDSVSNVESSAENVNDSAANVNTAANSVNEAADSIDHAASDLAYTADDINAATEELKGATEELKKPLVEQKSSNSKKATKQKNSSKK